MTQIQDTTGDRTPPKLIELYRQIAELTAPRCGKRDGCGFQPAISRHRCCDSMYCLMAIDYAKEMGVTLTPTGHSELPMMGHDGCTAPPHLRPLCSKHDCKINGVGYDSRNPEFSDKFLALYNEISAEEAKLYIAMKGIDDGTQA